MHDAHAAAAGEHLLDQDDIDRVVLDVEHDTARVGVGGERNAGSRRHRLGRAGVDLRALELAPLLDEALQFSEPLARQSGIALGAAYRNASPVRVLGDAVRLRQVFINLLSNAIKYNRPGGSVHLRLGRDGGRVLIDVVDTGLGMTREQIEHLYEPFNRLGRERGGIEGSGIGLALTRQLVRLMGGEFEIDSEIGRGTSARVSLPQVDAGADTFVAGSAIFGKPDYKAVIDAMRAQLAT
jgi:signal transduction histidine kinase